MSLNTMLRKAVAAAALTTFILSLPGCSARKDIVYLQDIQPEIVMALQEPKYIRFQPGDRIDIQVHSRDAELAQMFNLQSGGSGTGSGSGRASYTVDELGQIEMPVIGIVNVKDLTRLELANVIKYKLMSSRLIRDPVVTVEYTGVGYYTLGSIGSGYHVFQKDKLTLLEALSECGDLNINGRRDNVLVLRTENGRQVPYVVNLTNVSDVYSSPVYYLQQDDMIYVEPNETAVNASSPMGNTWRTPMFYVSLFTMMVSIITLFTK